MMFKIKMLGVQTIKERIMRINTTLVVKKVKSQICEEKDP